MKREIERNLKVSPPPLRRVGDLLLFHKRGGASMNGEKTKEKKKTREREEGSKGRERERRIRKR